MSGRDRKRSRGRGGEGRRGQNHSNVYSYGSAGILDRLPDAFDGSGSTRRTARRLDALMGQYRRMITNEELPPQNFVPPRPSPQKRFRASRWMSPGKASQPGSSDANPESAGGRDVPRGSSAVETADESPVISIPSVPFTTKTLESDGRKEDVGTGATEAVKSVIEDSDVPSLCDEDDSDSIEYVKSPEANDGKSETMIMSIGTSTGHSSADGMSSVLGLSSGTTSSTSGDAMTIADSVSLASGRRSVTSGSAVDAISSAVVTQTPSARSTGDGVAVSISTNSGSMALSTGAATSSSTAGDMALAVGTSTIVAEPNLYQSLDDILGDLELSSSAVGAAAALCNIQENDLVTYASRASELVPRLLDIVSEYPNEQVKRHAKRLSVSLVSMGQGATLVGDIANAARAKDFDRLANLLKYVSALEKPSILSAMRENGGSGALSLVLEAYPGTNLASLAMMNVGRLTLSMVGSVPRVPIPSIGGGSSVIDKEALAVMALKSLKLKDDPSRPSIESFVKSFNVYKPELLKLAYAPYSAFSEELTIQEAYSATPRFPFDMEEFRASRSDVANLSVNLAPFQDMMRELHAKHAILSCCPADSKISLDNIKGRKLIIFLSNFATARGGLKMLKHGTMCGEGDKCLSIHEEMMSALESIKKVPPGTARRFADCAIHVNTTPALAQSSWASGRGDMPCTKTQADAVTQPFLGKALVALKSALEDKHGATVEAIIPCGEQARKALSRIDDRSRQDLSVPLKRSMDLDLHVDLAHAWELMRSDKREHVLENHICGLQTIGVVLCSSRNIASIKELVDADYAMVTYKCGLSAGTMSEERRAKANEQRRETIAANTNAAKAAAKSATARANLANSVANMTDEAKKRQQQNRIASRAKHNEMKPYGCMSPPNKTLTITGRGVPPHQYDNVTSPCNCGWYEEEILKTFEANYPKNRRSLRWMETEEHGVVLLHYSTSAAGASTTLCGIIYNRSTNKIVRKKDFKAKKKSS